MKAQLVQTKFDNEYQSIHLKRYPASKNNSLQAWNAADSYLLEHLNTHFSITQNSNILIVNDAFGALTLSLGQFKPTSLTDSYLSQKAIQNNAQINNFDISTLNIIHQLQKSNGTFDFILIKTPKILDYLDDLLIQIRNHIQEDTVILIAGMVKNMPKTLWNLLESRFGPTKTSLTKKKAKIIQLKIQNTHSQSKYPIVFEQENTHLKIYSFANVFSKNSLDIGTRFLLQNLPKLVDVNSIIDLGCGNGIIGLNLAFKYPKASISFVDESYAAIESARLTCQHNLDDNNQHNFIVNDSLTDFASNSADFIVCNPPFHQSHDLSIDTALKMFHQSFATLVKGGYFLVIANRHLPYRSHLKRIFNNVETIASNRKFNLFLMVKSK